MFYASCSMKMNWENSKFSWQSFMSTCQELFPEPHVVLDLSYCKVGMDAQGYSEGIVGGSPPASPRPM